MGSSMRRCTGMGGMYAIHLADMLWLQRECFPLKVLLADKLDLETEVWLDHSSFDGVGVAFKCPDEQAEAIIGLIHAAYTVHSVRIFRSNAEIGGWRKVRAPAPWVAEALKQ